MTLSQLLSKAGRSTASQRLLPRTSELVRRSFSTVVRQDSEQFENVKPMFDLKSKNFVVTGGGQGIGFAITRAICEMGGNVAVMDLKGESTYDLRALASTFGTEVKYVQTDVTKLESLRRAFDGALSSFSSIDGCVTSAGIALDKPFLDQNWEEARRVLDVNVMGTFFATQMAAEQMRKQNTGGSIVMLASVCADVAVPGHRLAIYNASKGAVKMLSRALAVELAPHQIRTNTISPGYTETELTRKQRDQNPSLVEIMQNAPPMRRIGTVNDLTGAAIYLLSDASRYTTGTDLQITGGVHAGRIEWR